MSNDSPGPQEDSDNQGIEFLPELAERSVSLLDGAAREVVETKAAAEMVLDLPESSTSTAEREAAREALEILAPLTDGIEPDVRVYRTTEPAVPEEFIPDGEVVLGDFTEAVDE